MANNNNFPEVTSITSEALQAQIRALLPSQQGFSTDLMAQNVIVPIIDLTSAAEGSILPQNLQTAWGFGSGFDLVRATTTDVINGTGFWQFGLTCTYDAGGTTGSFVFIDDGTSTKEIWYGATTGAGSGRTTISYQGVVYLRSGDNLSVTAASGDEVAIWYRQIATVNGVLVNPLGFVSQ